MHLLSQKAFLLILGLLFVQIPASAQMKRTVSDVDSRTAIDNVIDEQAGSGFTGSVLVARDGKLIVDRYAGKEFEGDDRPSFWLASNSKPITAIAIFKLKEQGRLSLTDPITKFFKNVPTDKSQITISDLLTHTSGFPHVYVAEGIVDRDAAVKKAFETPLQYKTVDGWHYANLNFTLLAAIVEVASGRSFEDYVRREIFGPAAMKESGFWGYQGDAKLARSPNPMMLMNMNPKVYSGGKSVANWGFRGATGLYSTVDDLYRLVKALREGKILKRSSLDEMWSPAVFIRNDPGTSVYSGYGWYVVMKDGKRIGVRHSGSEDVIGHNGVIWIYENGDVSIVLSNAGEVNGQGRSSAVSSAINKVLSTQ